ncbi:MAG: hypothetical protein IKU62_05050 [Ruminiclostridium sp.]|nr:hypothetical protein [Ruminiclostridium sp.]
MKRILPLLLCLLLLGGCGGQTATEAPADLLFGDHLDLSQLSAAALADTAEYPEASDAGDILAAEIAETMGDAMTLYVYITALPVVQDTGNEGDTEDQMPAEVYLSENDNPLSCPNIHRSCELTEEGVWVLRCYFNFDREVFRGQEITLHVEDWLGDDLTFTWSPTNQGPIRYADLKDEDGSMAGTFNLNTFSLNCTLWSPPFETFEDTVRSIALLDENGEEIPITKVSLSGSTSTVHISFSNPIDPTTVKTVKIGPYTAELG